VKGVGEGEEVDQVAVEAGLVLDANLVLVGAQVAVEVAVGLAGSTLERKRPIQIPNHLTQNNNMEALIQVLKVLEAVDLSTRVTDQDRLEE